MLVDEPALESGQLVPKRPDCRIAKRIEILDRVPVHLEQAGAPIVRDASRVWGHTGTVPRSSESQTARDG